MNCQACGKFFSGEVPWNQHINSEKHKKKVALLNDSSNYPASTGLNLLSQSNQIDPLHCPACNITCDSILNFQRHSLSLEHVNNVSKRSNQINVDTTIGSTSTERNDPKIDEKLSSLYLSANDETDMILPEPLAYYKSSHMFNLSCTICLKQFSGPEPYKQHIESAVHKKKAELQNSVSPGAGQSVFGPLYCDVCKKMFSGKIPYEQHMNSETHKKRVQNLQFLEKYKTNGSSVDECDSSGGLSSGITDIKKFQLENHPFFCKLCNVPCSGEVPFRQHVSGETHMKNLRRVQLPKSNVSSTEFQSSDSQSEEVVHASVNSNRLLALTTSIDRNCVLPEMIDHLNIVPVVDLNIKEFGPEDKLDLDELQNNENRNKNQLKNKNECQDSSVGQSKDDQLENTAVYEECQYCKVKLQNKDEALAHFDSIEHFDRRWQMKGFQ